MIVVLLAVVHAAWPVSAAASELSGIVTLTTEYIYRGQSKSDRNPALQAGIDYEHDSGFFGGAWASTVDLPNPTGRRDAELNVYAGYHFESESPVSASVSLVHYTYPGQTTSFSYDYTEVLATLSWDGRYSLEFGYADDVYGFGVSGQHLELRADWPLQSAFVISAGLGINDLDNLNWSRYVYGDLGVSARFSRLTVDLRWYSNEEPAGLPRRLSAGSRR